MWGTLAMATLSYGGRSPVSEAYSARDLGFAGHPRVPMGLCIRAIRESRGVGV